MFLYSDCLVVIEAVIKQKTQVSNSSDHSYICFKTSLRKTYVAVMESDNSTMVLVSVFGNGKLLS